MEEYICDQCYIEMDIHEVGYLGAPLSEAPTQECHPFTALETLCRECYKQRK